MAKHQVVIEQLYEDASAPIQPPSKAEGSRTTRKSKGAQEMKGHSKKSSNKSRSVSVISHGELETLKSALHNVTSNGTRRPKSSSASSGNRTPEKTINENTMASRTALTLYRSKLTNYETREILQYPMVYYLGTGAEKIGSDGIETDLKQFDDKDDFYKVVPKDHIAYRFEVSEKPTLGKGTFAQVIKAYDHKEGRQVALKLVRNERIYLKQSREELRILQVLRKQDPHGIYNVLHMYEFFMFRNHMVICFELLGMNLYQVLKRNNYRGLALSRILPIGKAVLKCLELLFKNRIIHCDIKPENIMLRRNGDVTSVKVGDFGSSCYEQQQVYRYIQSRYYRAPEVILGIRYGPAIDIWSFGCVLSELNVGQPIFMGADEDDQLSAIEEVLGEVPKSLMNKAKSPRSSTRKKNRGAPGSKVFNSLLDGDDHFKDLIRKSLELEPNARPTAIELLKHPWFSPSKMRASVPTTKSKADTAISTPSTTASQGSSKKKT